MNFTTPARISPLENAHLRAKNAALRGSPEENLLFLRVKLQHKDSKKVLLPYEIRFFSSSIRIAIGE